MARRLQGLPDGACRSLLDHQIGIKTHVIVREKFAKNQVFSIHDEVDTLRKNEIFPHCHSKLSLRKCLCVQLLVYCLFPETLF